MFSLFDFFIILFVILIYVLLGALMYIAFKLPYR